MQISENDGEDKDSNEDTKDDVIDTLVHGSHGYGDWALSHGKKAVAHGKKMEVLISVGKFMKLYTWFSSLNMGVILGISKRKCDCKIKKGKWEIQMIWGWG